MTAESPAPPPGAPGHSINKSVLVAGLLGGLVGALASYALARSFPHTPKPVPAPPSEARQFADHVIGKLKDGKHDEFTALLRPAFAQMSNEDYAAFCTKLFEQRASAPKSFGAGGDFEFLHETAPTATLTRVTYVEKYARGCMVWCLVVYNTPDGWQMSAFSVQAAESGFPALR